MIIFLLQKNTTKHWQPTSAQMTAVCQFYLTMMRFSIWNKAQFLVSGLDGASAAVLGASAIGWEIQ